MDYWVVTYSYRGSKYFDSPLYRRVERISFPTYQAAWDWADNEHPALPDFRVLCIHNEPEIITSGPSGVYPGSAEARHHSDHCTDMAILRK